MTGTPESPEDISQGQGTGSTSAGTVGTPSIPSFSRPALGNLHRQLTDADFDSPGARKLLLEALDKADADCANLKPYVDRFHVADKRAAVLETKLGSQKAPDIAFGVFTAVGGAAFGLAPGLWDKQPYGWIVLIVGAVLILAGVAVGVSKK